MGKETARKSTGLPHTNSKSGSSSGSPQPVQSSSDIEIIDNEPKRGLNNSKSFNAGSSLDNNASKHNSNSSSAPIKPSPDTTPMELQIRQVELMEEQCDSLEKLVEIAAEHRDIQREILEIKKRKLAILERQSNMSLD